jgi:hypothetical protein
MGSCTGRKLFDDCWNDVRRVLIASAEPLTSPVIGRGVRQYNFAYVRDVLRAMRVQGVVKRTYHGRRGPERRVTYEWVCH